MGRPTSSTPDDFSGQTEILVGRAKSGCEEAWKVLYGRYRKMLLAHVEVRLPGFARRRMDAEDVLQSGITKAWQRIQSYEYRGEGSFRRWLARVVVNTCVDEIEAQRSGALQQHGSERALERAAERDASEKDELERSRTAMLEAMGQMDEEDRDLLIQRIIEELTFAQIAVIQGFSREKAREQYAAALERLERRLRA